VCRKLHFSPDIIKGTESRGMRWAGRMARIGDNRSADDMTPEGK